MGSPIDEGGVPILSHLDLSIAEVDEIEAPVSQFQAGFGVGLIAVGIAVAIT